MTIIPRTADNAPNDGEVIAAGRAVQRSPFAKAVQASDLPSSLKLLLLVLAWNGPADGSERWQSNRQLAAACSLTDRQIRRLTNTALSLGWLVADSRPGRTNLWQLAMPAHLKLTAKPPSTQDTHVLGTQDVQVRGGGHPRPGGEDTHVLPVVVVRGPREKTTTERPSESAAADPLLEVIVKSLVSASAEVRSANRGRLIAAADTLAAAGWTAVGLRTMLPPGTWNGARTPAAVFNRLADLGTGGPDLAISSRSAPHRLLACSTCGAMDGDPRALRQVQDGTGRWGTCPACRPADVQQAQHRRMNGARV